MKTLLVLISLVAAGLCNNGPLDLLQLKNVNFVQAHLWQNFKRQFQKTYQSKADEVKHFKTFLDNTAFINKHNRAHKDGFYSYTLRMNQFGDLSNQEYQNTYRVVMVESRGQNDTENSGNDSEEDEAYDYKIEDLSPIEDRKRIPEAINHEKKTKWNNKVRNQGACRAGYAFAATGLLEYTLYSKLRLKTDLSEQELMDCSSAESVPETHRNSGCRGGSVVDVLHYAAKKNSLGSSDKYPYIGENARCRRRAEDNALLKSLGRFKGVTRIVSRRQVALMKALEKNGPLAVHIDASPKTFQFYHKGVYTDPTCSGGKPLAQRQTALLVGFVKNSHWVVRNSFGNTWGDNGVILLPMKDKNPCGMNDLVVFAKFELTPSGKDYVGGDTRTGRLYSTSVKADINRKANTNSSVRNGGKRRHSLEPLGK